MRAFKALVVVALFSGLAITMTPKAETPAAETPMMVNTPVATL